MAEEQADNSSNASKPALPATYLLFQEPDPTTVIRRPAPEPQTGDDDDEERKPRRRGSRGRGRSTDSSEQDQQDSRDNNKGGKGNKGHKDQDGDRDRKNQRNRRDNDNKDDQSDSDQSDDSSTASSDSDSNEKDDEPKTRTRTRSRSQRRSRDQDSDSDDSDDSNDSGNDSQDSDDTVGTTRRRRRRRSTSSDEVTALKGSTRLEAKRQRRRDGREAGRRRHSITESEFLARRESVSRKMLVREQDGLNQIAVLEDDILVEHYVARHTQVSMVGNVYLGRVQNVLPSMEAAFVDIGKGRNAVLYAGEVNWEAAGLEGKPRRIESALSSGETVLVQVTKDPIGHKGARLTAQITLAGRHLVLVPSGAMTGISRKLPERERQRLKKLLKEIVPAEHGVIVRTAAEGASEDQLRKDVERLTQKWADIQQKSKSAKSAPVLLKGEPELAVRVVRDVFNEDFESLHVQGNNTYSTIKEYVHELSPELDERVHKWVANKDVFTDARVDEQLAKAMDRKVYLPSGGSLVIDRTEAMTVVDVNTGRFTGSGGTLEETVTKNNLEAAEEIVRQLRLRDIGGIIVIDFIDMVLESNRDLVLRRLIECLGRDRTRHQVAEVTSLGLVQMTRKRVGQGLVEAFSTTCEHCEGRGYHIHTQPVEKGDQPKQAPAPQKQQQSKPAPTPPVVDKEETAKREEVKSALASIAAAAAQIHQEDEDKKEDAKPRGRRSSARRSESARNASTNGTDSASSSSIPDLTEDLSKLAEGASSKNDGSKGSDSQNADSQNVGSKNADSRNASSKGADSQGTADSDKSAGRDDRSGSRGRVSGKVGVSGKVQPGGSGTDSSGHSAGSADSAEKTASRSAQSRTAYSEPAAATPPAERKARRVASSGTIVTTGGAIIVAEKPKGTAAKTAPKKPAPKPAGKPVEEKVEDENRKSRRSASSGTIIPKSSSAPGIMTFPTK
ncbi:MAG: Rne/Rng family ribonuclease [Flaviflexus sp.]|uniref:Rne/Rng family ribonuclease n=1 Tax=Flaviflexus sp. TaxID=1969482 RepID=UPI003F8E93E1